MNMDEAENVILSHVFIGETRLTDLVSSGRLMSVGFCRECDHCQPALTGVVNGEVKELTPLRCPRMASGFTQPNGWCYHFAKDGRSIFLDEGGYIPGDGSV